MTSESRWRPRSPGGQAGRMEMFRLACTGFERILESVQDEQWTWPTPCAEWNVRQLVNHMTRGNLNYAGLARGGSAVEFAAPRNVDALGDDPVGAFVASVRECTTAFAEPGVPQRMVDYALGRIPGRQALALRTADSTIHTWDLARAVGADERLDDRLVTWLDDNLADIFAGLAETPLDPATTHRLFAPPNGAPARDTQERLLRLMGR